VLLDSAVTSPTTEEWISIVLELVVNSLGLLVAMNGIQGTNTLDQQKVRGGEGEGGAHFF
jgi:hypothetical protein